ncbi:hypothetical protein M8494_03400 [Serratia ureilytica]
MLNLLQRPDLGGEDWWRQVAELGTPLVESLPAAQVRVTFFWRDPWGDERRSPIKGVCRYQLRDRPSQPFATESGTPAG